MSFSLVTLSYVYQEPETWRRFELARSNAGWPQSLMFTQLVHTFGKVNRQYYIDAARLDASARGYSTTKGEYFSKLASGAELPPYKDNRPPRFGETPLDIIGPVDTKLSRKSFSRFKASAINAAIFHLARLIDESNAPAAMTKLMRWYYADKADGGYWDVYLPQLAADYYQDFTPNIIGFDPFAPGVIETLTD